MSENELQEDFQQLGSALASLYMEAINGVVCDPEDTEYHEPGRHACEKCLAAWKRGMDVLGKYDAEWGNLQRSGPNFQPGAASPTAEAETVYGANAPGAKWREAMVEAARGYCGPSEGKRLNEINRELRPCFIAANGDTIMLTPESVAKVERVLAGNPEPSEAEVEARLRNGD